MKHRIPGARELPAPARPPALRSQGAGRARTAGRLAWLIPAVFNLALLATAPLVSRQAAAEASLFIYPTLVMFDGHRTSAEVTISNRGDEAGTFEIGWANMSMTPEGGLARHDADVPWSVQPFLRYSPRRVTLEPAASQVIKIALRRDATVPEAEYYSHMRVVTINSGATAADEDADPDPEGGVAITARAAIAIPVIWRNSGARPQATIESITVDAPASALTLDVARSGPLSVRGFVHVVAGQESAEPIALAAPVPLILYPNIDRRSVSITLADGIDIAHLPADAAVLVTAEDTLTERSVIYARRQVSPEP
jgi:P pilus assembly chaperone PapD